MKKILMMVAAAMMAVVSVNAQQPVGGMWLKPMVGGTLSTVTKSDDAKMKLGIVAGGEFGYQVAEPFAVSAGLLVSMQGAKMKDNNYMRDESSTMTYLNIPVLANFYLTKGLAIKAGLQPGFLLSRKWKGEENVNGKWESFDESSTDGMKKVDLSIPFGLSYEISDFVIDARYNLGLTKIVNSNLVDSKNSVIMLTIGYMIPF